MKLESDKHFHNDVSERRCGKFLGAVRAERNRRNNSIENNREIFLSGQRCSRVRMSAVN